MHHVDGHVKHNSYQEASVVTCQEARLLSTASVGRPTAFRLRQQHLEIICLSRSCELRIPEA